MDPILSHWAYNMDKILKLILEKLELLKQFSPTFRNIVFCEAKASKGKKNDILEN
jgi:hypothetical protein